MANFEIKSLNKQITALGKKTEKWRNDVQECLIGCVYQSIEGDSNIDPCKRILEVLKGSDVKAVMHWLESRAPVRIKGGTFVFNKSFDGAFNEELLRSEKWWADATKPEQVKSQFDAESYLDAVIKHIVKNGAANDAAVEYIKAAKGVFAKAKVA